MRYLITILGMHGRRHKIRAERLVALLEEIGA
jgi:hypothetical protein